MLGCDAARAARIFALPHSPSHPDGHLQRRATHPGVAQHRADQHRNAGTRTHSGLDTTHRAYLHPTYPHPRGDTRTRGDADTHSSSHLRTHTDADADTNTVSVLDAAGGSRCRPRARTGRSSHNGSAGSDFGSGRSGACHR